ncbi:ParB family protein [uncultured Arthrobacter sp.]|uniref:ParB family protein n=1 Tax=uncultured Arthrobacter sp. TaxID=114050 RepID=UPI0025DA8900|nr:hypothetical protein [uncultured Arthrobacter sp.]
MSTVPASGRGGPGNSLNKLKPKGMKKAPSRSVIEEMVAPPTHPEPEPAGTRDHPAPETRATVPAPIPIQNGPADELTARAPARPAPEVVTESPAPLPPVRQGVSVPAAVNSAKAESTVKKTGYWEPIDLGIRMRAAYINTRHFTGHQTLSDFICSLIEAECERLEKEYNNGEQFPSLPNGVPRGRPVR